MTRASVVGWILAAAATLALAAESEQSPPRNPQPPIRDGGRQRQPPIRDGGRQRRAGRGPGDPIVKAWVVYDQHCVACHGRNLEGGAAGSLIDGVWTFGGDDAHIVETIREAGKERRWSRSRTC